MAAINASALNAFLFPRLMKNDGGDMVIVFFPRIKGAMSINEHHAVFVAVHSARRP
jgi:hypothetical protein